MPKDSPYTEHGVAVWAPRVRLVSIGTEERSGGTYVEFKPSDDMQHVWAVPPERPTFELSAVVHSTVQLEPGREYFVYVVPVDALIPTGAPE